MLLLKTQHVMYCNVVRQRLGQLDMLSGLAYQNHLFVRGESYEKHQYRAAVKRVRNLLDEEKKQIFCLVVEDQQSFTVWYHDQKLQLVENLQNKEQLVAQINLKKLVKMMRSTTRGVPLKNRRYFFRSYSQCMLGSEIVSWLTKTLNISEAEAFQLGQRLIDEKWIYPLGNQQQLKNKNWLYRFSADQ